MIKDDEILKNKVTLITGARGGIGRKISSKFAELGSYVYLCDINDSSDLAEEINKNNNSRRAKPVICDISNSNSVEEMYNTIVKENNGVDILINNAAVRGPKGPDKFPDISYEGFKNTINIDLSGAVYCILNVLPHMIKNKWGRIIFTAAPLSSSGIPAPYLAGKSGFIGLAKKIAEKYANLNILTFALVLRHTDTPMIRRVLHSRGIDEKEGIKKLNEKSLTGRMITPAEIAELYAYFATAANDCVKDLSLLADGGITYMK